MPNNDEFVRFVGALGGISVHAEELV